MTVAWTDAATHRDWLARHAEGLLAFGRRTPYPGGGAAWLDDEGKPAPENGLETWITCRTVHVFSVGALLGVPGARPVAEAALAGLLGPLHDDVYGGWFTSRAADGTPAPGKTAYAHAFVILAASSATVAGVGGGDRLLSDALAVFERRFWDEEEGRALDTWDRRFTTLDQYRGLNANMHTVEAFLAAADVTGERVWLQRATRIAEFAVSSARANGWRLPEHFTADWTPLPDLNSDHPEDRFKPYGATVGHGLEWSRLLLHVEAAGADGSDWLVPAQATVRSSNSRRLGRGRC